MCKEINFSYSPYAYRYAIRLSYIALSKFSEKETILVEVNRVCEFARPTSDRAVQSLSLPSIPRGNGGLTATCRPPREKLPGIQPRNCNSAQPRAKRRRGAASCSGPCTGQVPIADISNRHVNVGTAMREPKGVHAAWIACTRADVSRYLV